MAKDPFDGMSHEEMLEWLDKANSGTVQAAADRLVAAAKEIHSIAEDLKVRPQWVNWKGDGAEAFRTWAGDLANATLALGDFSQDSSKWLGQAATAISTAQVSIPRDKASAQANLDAAKAAHNDPDAAAVAGKSSSELQAIAANKEKVRQEAAGEMRKLGQAYSLSSTQMGSLARPKFPPPPDAVVPHGGSSQDLARPGATGSGSAAEAGTPTGSRDAATGHAVADQAQPRVVSDERPHARITTPDVPPSDGVRPADVAPPARMDIDSVDTLPETAQGRNTPPGPSAPGTGPQPPVTGATPPAYGGPTPNPVAGRPLGPPAAARGATSGPSAMGSGKPTGTSPGTSATGRPSSPGTRSPMTGGQGVTGTGRPAGGGRPGRLPTNNGVAGGRPQAPTGKSGSGIPRGTVVGGETGGGASTGRTAPGIGRPSGGRPGAAAEGAVGQRGGATSGRRGASQGDGIVGGRGQQQGRAGARSFSSGGSGLVRGQNSAGNGGPEESRATNQSGRAGSVPSGARPGRRREENQEERPDYVVEDEATWQADARRNVPSVVDDTSKNSER
ncbi:translation initiation factor IF-2 [Streptomyces sp. cg35]|uniref:translation initiation factor IF-2 n=1 Tax=Streptomyces sp. cg35 TaxID=3421650 RepID=UPI003D16F921